MTARETIISQKGGKCSYCDEQRIPALQVMLPYKVERTSAWETYYQLILKHHISSVSIVCKNCHAVQRTEPKEAGPQQITVVKGLKGQKFPWLEHGLVLTPDGGLYSYPKYAEVPNRWGLQLPDSDYIEVRLFDSHYEEVNA